MKTIGIALSPENIFNKCSYWTLNRVLLSEDANHSKIINDAYGMTTDDKEYFFKDEYKKACAELSILTIPLRKNLRLTDRTGILPNGFRHSFNTDETIFYFYIANKVPLDIFIPLITEFLKLTILKNWYELKNIHQEVSIIEQKLIDVRKRIKIIVSTYKQDEEIKLPYNNGFNIQDNEEDGHPPIVVDIVNVGIFTYQFTEEYN